MWLFLISHIATVPEHLSCVALPFGVLGIATLICIYLTVGNQLFKFLRTANDGRGYIFAECQPLHYSVDILKLNSCRIY